MNYQTVLDHHQITVPAHLQADMTVPVLTGLQRQGDLLIVPTTTTATGPVPTAGVQLVVGEATGNTHWLHGDGPVFFDRATQTNRVGTVTVPAGSVGYVVHTDEHGANGIAPGSYLILRAREQADELRLVAD